MSEKKKNLLVNFYGEVEYEGIEVAITHRPFVSVYNNKMCFMAHGTDRNKNNYIIKWPIKNYFYDHEDYLQSYDDTEEWWDWSKYTIEKH